MTARTDPGVTPKELALLLDAIEDYAIFLLGPTGEIRSWNSGAARTMGYAAEDVIGSNFSRFYGPGDLDAAKPQTELDIASREGRVEDEGWRTRKDGTRFWANTVITALRDEQGEVTGFAKITRDLTIRREAEMRLRHSEEIFRLLVASVKDYAIFMLDPQGRVATWNAGAERIKGYAPSEIIGRHFSTFYREEEKRNGKPERELEIAMAEGSVEDEGWRLRKDGTAFWANVVITAVYDETGELRGFAKVTRDMTERKRAEEALLEQREARFKAEDERRRAEASYRVAQESNRAKDEFLMTLSHELRTPLTSILGWSRMLPTMSPHDEGFKDAVAAIGRSAQLQARLIDDVLDVSRIVSGKLRLNVENVDILRLLNTSIETVRPSADAKRIRIETMFEGELGTIVADSTRLQQVVWNLLTNAIKFTPKNGRVQLTARRTTSHLQIAVSDSGEGLDPGFLPHAFEPFRQAENPSTRVHGGLGLGLSIVRYLTEAHGGTVSAESAGRGKGATFTVTLPLGALQATRTRLTIVPAISEEVPVLARRLEGLSLLLVDDDAEGRQVFRALLTQAGARVTAMAAPEEALEHLGSNLQDIVLTDIAMPRMDGYTFARAVRERAPGQKMIALSAFPAGRSAHDSLFQAYILKPVEPSELVDVVARVAGR